jgi:ankyrin repeat protein
MTPLHLASFQGHEEVARLLIEHSADMTAQNKYGLTPLHLASQEGQVDVTCLLIECGADLMT